MAIAVPGEGRILVEGDKAGLRITIPAAIQTFSVLFLSLWLAGWAVGEIAGLRRLLVGVVELGLFLWFAGWTAGGALVIYALLWQILGKEVIELDSTMLRRLRRLLFFVRSRVFAVAGISNMRLAPPPPKVIRGKSVVVSPMTHAGTIAFDVGPPPHHLGHGLDEAEAEYVIAQMRERVKSLGSR